MCGGTLNTGFTCNSCGRTWRYDDKFCHWETIPMEIKIVEEIKVGKKYTDVVKKKTK